MNTVHPSSGVPTRYAVGVDAEFLRNAIYARDERILLLEQRIYQLEQELRVSTTVPATSMGVFCNCSSEELSSGQLTKEQFADFIAFHYGLCEDLTPYLGLDKEAFVAALRAFKNSEGEDFFDARATAPTIIYKALQFGAEHLGREFIVAVAGSQGGGLEIRRITGPYRFTEGVRCANGSYKYRHQFPTEKVRDLTPEESARVSEARKNKLALQWTCEL